MPKRTPYLEMVLTVAVLTFLALIVAGAFNQRADDVAEVALPHD